MKTAFADTQILDPVDLLRFDELYFQYNQAVYANILKLVHQYDAAEDLLQEVFMALWEHRHKLDGEKVSGWLFVTSYNKSLKYLQRQKKQATTDLSDTTIIENEYATNDTPFEEVYNMRLSMIEEAVNLLPERKKKVFMLYRYEGKSMEDVARMLDISVNSVKDYLKQSNRFIRNHIARQHIERGIAISTALLVYFN
jgi:RNA polymerase sigma-70 factor (ECF subfamily)